MAEDADAIPKLVNLLLKDAITSKIPKLWFENVGGDFRIMMEKDGAQTLLMRPPAELEEQLLARLRYMAGTPEEPSAGQVHAGRIQIRIGAQPASYWFDVAVFDRQAQARVRIICHGEREPSNKPELDAFFPQLLN